MVDPIWLYEQLAQALHSEAFDSNAPKEMQASYLALVVIDRLDNKNAEQIRNLLSHDSEAPAP